ncbi:MAG: hypothetical protein ACYCQJ_13000 [Nitrososphaerales archaeon]
MLNLSLGFLGNPIFELFMLVILIVITGVLFLLSRGNKNRGDGGGLLRTLWLEIAIVYSVFVVMIILVIFVNFILPSYVTLPPDITFSNVIFSFIVFNIVLVFVVLAFLPRLRGRLR